MADVEYCDLLLLAVSLFEGFVCIPYGEFGGHSHMSDPGGPLWNSQSSRGIDWTNYQKLIESSQGWNMDPREGFKKESGAGGEEETCEMRLEVGEAEVSKPGGVTLAFGPSY